MATTSGGRQQIQKLTSTFFDVARTNAHRRAGNNWEYDWSNLSGDQAVEDGDAVSHRLGPRPQLIHARRRPGI